MKMGDRGRMQVEVSKHTEGSKEKTLRPNGLPESLIRYDGMHWTRLLLYCNVSYLIILLHIYQRIMALIERVPKKKKKGSHNVYLIYSSIQAKSGASLCIWTKGPREL